MHPYYSNVLGFKSSQYPKTMQLYPRLVSLPLYPAMTEELVTYVIDSAKEILAASRKTTHGLVNANR